MNGRCGACKFWKRDFPDSTEGECERIAVDRDGYTASREDGALARAGGIELPAWLSTRASFGCVLWSGRDSAR